MKLSGVLKQLKLGWTQRRWLRQQRPRLVLLVPSRRRARNLEHVVKFLGKAQERLSPPQSDLARKIQHELGRVGWNVWTEALSYVALYSNKVEQQCLALRNLSQIEDEESIEHVENVIKGVLENPFTSDRVKRVAEAVLEELKSRRQMLDRQVSSGGRNDEEGDEK